jgi:hypothetical protein
MINGANLLGDAELLVAGREGCHDRGHGFETKYEEPEDLVHAIVRSVAKVSVERPRSRRHVVIQNQRSMLSNRGVFLKI